MNAILDSIPAIDIVEMDISAALRTRRDRKYVVPIRGLSEIVGALHPGEVRVLEVDGRRTSEYESIYLDTPDLACYWAAARRRRRRFKVRTRRYLENGEVYLEAKVRERRGFNAKHRLVVDEQDHGRLTPAGEAYLKGIDGVRAEPRQLGPTLVTRYGRTTFVSQVSPSRMTIDVGLTWALPDGADLRVPEIAIVETKSSGPPTTFDRLLWRAGHRPTKISKYGTGLAALDHTLPANKWNRFLKHHFGSSGSRPRTANSRLDLAGSARDFVGPRTQEAFS